MPLGMGTSCAESAHRDACTAPPGPPSHMGCQAGAGREADGGMASSTASAVIEGITLWLGGIDISTAMEYVCSPFAKRADACMSAVQGRGGAGPHFRRCGAWLAGARIRSAAGVAQDALARTTAV